MRQQAFVATYASISFVTIGWLEILGEPTHGTKLLDINAEPHVTKRIIAFILSQKTENIEGLAQPKLSASLIDLEIIPLG